MFTAIGLILIAWVIEMPLWLSVVVTLLSVGTIVVKLGGVVIEALNKWIEKHLNFKE